MPWIAAGASLIGGMLASDAAGDAASAQSAATDKSNARLEKQYEQTRTDLAPYRGYGGRAVSKLEQLLGLGGTPGGATAMTYEDARQKLLPQFTSTTSTPGGRWVGPSSEMEGGWVPGEPTTATSIDEAG